MDYDKVDRPVHADTTSSDSDNEKRYVDEALLDDVDLGNNISAKIKNPLAGLSLETLTRHVGLFADEHQLQEIKPLLLKGALVAQDPANFESVNGLLDDEREALANEVTHKWRQPKALYVTVILCSVGAAVQGWDQTGSNGANLSFPVEFGIPDSEDSPDYAKNLWLVYVAV